MDPLSSWFYGLVTRLHIQFKPILDPRVTYSRGSTTLVRSLQALRLYCGVAQF